jgi:hypothetical protein
MGRNYPVYGSHAYAEGHFIHVGIQCFLVLETSHHRLILCVKDSTHTTDQLIVLSDLEKDEILLIEHPVLKSNPLPPALLNEASINLLVVRANRTWKNTDQALYEHLLQVKQKEVPLLFYLTQADRNTVEDFTGQLPPYTNFKNMEYRLFQLGLTAIEYKGK